MPYKVIGRNVYHFKDGKWKLKQRAGSVAKAKATMNLLYGIESGRWKPTGKRRRGLAAASQITRQRVSSMGGRASR